VVGGTLVTTAEAVVTACDGHEHIGTPHDPLVLTATGLYGHYDGGTAAFNLPLDAGSAIGNGTQATISFDFDGNSVVDRTETYNYFATNDVAGWEIYSQNQQLAAHSGQYADFTGGGVTVEIWNTFGSGDVHLKAGAGLVLPHDLWI